MQTASPTGLLQIRKVCYQFLMHGVLRDFLIVTPGEGTTGLQYIKLLDFHTFFSDHLINHHHQQQQTLTQSSTFHLTLPSLHRPNNTISTMQFFIAIATLFVAASAIPNGTDSSFHDAQLSVLILLDDQLVPQSATELYVFGCWWPSHSWARK